MTAQTELIGDLHSRITITPRDYQDEERDETFRLFNEGMVGVLHRLATGMGKTIGACMCFERWLDRNPNNRCLVISYEKQLVWQFAQEIEDVMGFKPGIEMEKQHLDPFCIPRVVVASRQTLLPAPHQTEEQALELQELCLENTEAVPRRVAKMLISNLRDNWTTSCGTEVVDELNTDYRANRELRSFSRLYKFDPSYNWLLVFDEAHKHAHILRSVGHLVDWFDRNPESRRIGLTATPKRSDGVCLGSKMFPGVAIDYPLIAHTGRTAVAEGWAVKYDQRFVRVESLRFEQLDRVAGDFKDADLDFHLNNERELAKCVEPMLDMVMDRQTLIFSPTVDMANNVASYINARCRCTCPCGRIQWVPESLLGSGCKCRKCGEELPVDCQDRSGEQARAVWGTVPPKQRKVVYADHHNKEFQFLSVCGLCREGYNDQNIACVAVFRPVTKAASGLAEQMKGRGCRPLKGLVDGLETAEQRLEAIANSSKPDCLVVDLVGISGLSDCATTAAIYGEGLPDEVIERADAKLVRNGGGDVVEALKKAEEEIEAERKAAEEEKKRERQLAQEFAKRRAVGDVRVDYTTHKRGVNGRKNGSKTEATAKQTNYIRVLGLDLNGITVTKAQAMRIISQLKSGMGVNDVKYQNHLPKDCHESLASAKQRRYLQWRQIRFGAGLTFLEASRMIDEDKRNTSERTNKGTNLSGEADNPKLVSMVMDEMGTVTTNRDLDQIGRWVSSNDRFTDRDRATVIARGKARRNEIKELDF